MVRPEMGIPESVLFAGGRLTPQVEAIHGATALIYINQTKLFNKGFVFLTW